MSDTTTSNGTDGGTDGQGQQSTAPTTPADSTTPGQQTGNTETSGTGQEPAKVDPSSSGQGGDNGGGQSAKTFTQDDLDRIINERLEKQQSSMRKQFAQALGIEDPNAETDPAKLLEQQKSATTAAQTRADTAEAKALALAAGIKPERVDRFVKLVDVGAALKDVDRADAGKVSETLRTAVDTTLDEVPEFKAANTPPSSGGDRTGSNADSGKPVYTRAQIEGMSQQELADKADELTAAMAEGRIR